MKNIVEIKNVKNVVTDEIGTLYLIASKDKEAVQCDNVNHQGLSIFFKPEGGRVEYVKSYVFTDQEVRLVIRGKIDTIKDIGYYLNFTNGTMDIICLESAFPAPPAAPAAGEGCGPGRSWFPPAAGRWPPGPSFPGK